MYFVIVYVPFKKFIFTNSFYIYIVVELLKDIMLLYFSGLGGEKDEVYVLLFSFRS